MIFSLRNKARHFLQTSEKYQSNKVVSMHDASYSVIHHVAFDFDQKSQILISLISAISRA